ncbi:LPS export ABC transporter periplasmic protein LptC [Aliiglaciecola sp. LCG003]|uniref:LPS export ABC transporter periplasmic protein LptC n=1 Tax=Aliiglaciecola sp. LCG003 TaxID=3053655 RepID=UPI0025726C60|nr:LPS export ABC transporter periplasmic protein LptC [Aliiglaciecola sp. LCG003]WJG08864.1 LPS export ABC transporter periplasmic protein LptC [Aliiglaciecola sp. LCG003]
MSRITISIGLLFLLVLLIYVPSWMSADPQNTNETNEESWRPNYQARNMRSTLYNEFGEINHQVFALKMEHYQLLGFTLFSQPRYTIYVADQQNPWHVEATEGTLYDDNRIQLETDVEIRSLDESGFIQTIKTQFLEINLGDKTMMSDQPVQINGKNFVVMSNGFSANLATQEYELKDHVQTQYAPR